MKRFIVWSPDGIPISPASYKSSDDARSALARWVKGYAIQGYYSDSRGNRISLDDLPSRCRIQAYKKGEQE
jgi:hypothetical protein